MRCLERPAAGAALLVLFLAAPALAGNPFTTEQKLADADSSTEFRPSADASGVAWGSFRDGLYYWDGSTIFQITDNSVPDYNPSLADGLLAWQRGSEIWVSVAASPAPEPGTCVLFGGGVLLLAGFGRRRMRRTGGGR